MRKTLGTFDEFMAETYSSGNTFGYGARNRGIVDWEKQNKQSAEGIRKDIGDIKKKLSTEFKIDTNNVSFDGDRISIELDDENSGLFKAIKAYIRKEFDKDSIMKKAKG